MFDIAHYRIND